MLIKYKKQKMYSCWRENCKSVKLPMQSALFLNSIATNLKMGLTSYLMRPGSRWTCIFFGRSCSRKIWDHAAVINSAMMLPQQCDCSSIISELGVYSVPRSLTAMCSAEPVPPLSGRDKALLILTAGSRIMLKQAGTAKLVINWNMVVNKGSDEAVAFYLPAVPHSKHVPAESIVALTIKRLYLKASLVAGTSSNVHNINLDVDTPKIRHFRMKHAAALFLQPVSALYRAGTAKLCGKVFNNFYQQHMADFISIKSI